MTAKKRPATASTVTGRLSKTTTSNEGEEQMKSTPSRPVTPVTTPRIVGRRCSDYYWCESEHDDGSDEPGNPYHHGILTTAESGESSVDLDQWKDNDGSGYNFEIPSWNIAPADAEMEITDLRIIIDQFEAAIKAVAAEAV